jgi:hypothetical protein
MTEYTKTRYPGVFTRKGKVKDGRSANFFYIRFTKDRKKFRESIGHSLEGMTAAKANKVRSDKMSGSIDTKRAKREAIRKNQLNLCIPTDNELVF